MLGAAIVAPPIVAIACLAFRPWHPTDDLAIIQLRVHDLWSIHTPLTGLYSRPGWNHPGPMMFWLMGLISAPTGQASWAVRISGPVLQAGALVWLGVAAARHSTRMLLAAASVAALTFLGISADVFRLPWNLCLPLPFFVLLLLISWFLDLVLFLVVICLVFV
jgi:hypothetical protein